ncbi:hypothetical protein Tco_0630516, partial [Tanacetum coccineum]
SVGTDLVRNANTALAGKASSVSSVETAVSRVSLLKAAASSFAVRGRFCSSVKTPNAEVILLQL